MKIVRYLALGLLVAVGACSRDTDGEIVTPDPVAGLRYVNLVSDTGAMDFRIVNYVGDAPNTVAATFRTGGQPFGNINVSPTQPPYLPVRAGTATQIRIFMNGTTAAVASTVMFDTTLTFDANMNYTFYLYGSARTGTAGRCCSVMVTRDSVPTIPAGKFALRVLNLAPNYTGSPAGTAAGTPVDVRTILTNAAATGAGAAAISNVGFGTMSNYAFIDTTVANGSVPYRLWVTANGTATPTVFQTIMPTGTRGTSTSNPFAGTSVVGTAITAVITSRSTASSAAPQTAPSAATTIDSIIRSNDTVTVVRSVAAATATACQSAVAAGAAVNDIVIIGGATQPEYNGYASVVAATAGTSPTNFPTCTTPALVRSRIRYRLSGTPVSPATGTPTIKVVTNTNDYSVPAAIFLYDKQPPRTAP